MKQEKDKPTLNPQFDAHWQKTWNLEKTNVSLAKPTSYTPRNAFNPHGSNNPKSAVFAGLVNLLLIPAFKSHKKHKKDPNLIEIEYWSASTIN